MRDHFELLGVSPRASAVELRAAYALLARTLHPDACRDPALADLNEQREAVFLRVCQAYETLRDPEARTVYERDFRRRKPGPPLPPLLARDSSRHVPGVRGLRASGPEAPSLRAPVPPPGPEPPPPSLEERLGETIAGGEELLRDGHYWEAIQQLEPTLQQARGELRVRARLALARACVKNPKWLKRAETHLQDVVHEDPERVEAHLLLGDIYRAGNLRARALAAYRKVLDLQPHNRQALRELARLEAEEPPPAQGIAAGVPEEALKHRGLERRSPGCPGISPDSAVLRAGRRGSSPAALPPGSSRRPSLSATPAESSRCCVVRRFRMEGSLHRVRRGTSGAGPSSIARRRSSAWALSTSRAPFSTSFRVTAGDEQLKWTPSASSSNVIPHLRDPKDA